MMPARSEVLIRSATRADDPAVTAVECEAFGRTDEAALVVELTASEAFVAGLSLVAEQGGRVVGHVLFTRARAGDVESALLAPLAVLPDRQGAGVGSALVREGLRQAAEAGFGLALVLGHPAYYGRFGFKPAEPHGVMPPYPVQPAEAWMLVELVPGALATASGVVELAEALMHEELWRE